MNILKNTELYPLNECIVWYMKYIFINLLTEVTWRVRTSPDPGLSAAHTALSALRRSSNRVGVGLVGEQQSAKISVMTDVGRKQLLVLETTHTLSEAHQEELARHWLQLGAPSSNGEHNLVTLPHLFLKDKMGFLNVLHASWGTCVMTFPILDQHYAFILEFSNPYP